MNAPIATPEPVSVPILVPITLLYIDSFTAFFQRHGCLTEDTGVLLYNARLFQITFPSGTLRQHLVQARDPRYLIILPDGAKLEEVQSRNHATNYSYVYADPNA